MAAPDIPAQELSLKDVPLPAVLAHTSASPAWSAKSHHR